MSGQGWQWALCFVGIAYVIVSVVVMAFAKWHKKRFREILPAPQSTVVRHVYNESAYRVGCMSGVGK